MTVSADARPASGVRTWHRFHYAVGVFLVAYGVAGLVSGALLWGDRVEEIEGYFGSGPAAGVLAFVKAVEALLVLCAVAGAALRRDVLFVPPLAGWMAGFAMFAVLDVFKGRWGGLIEHLLYLAAFVWENVLLAHPESTRYIVIGAVLVAMMIARPQGLLGEKRVEIV